MNTAELIYQESKELPEFEASSPHGALRNAG